MKNLLMFVLAGMTFASAAKDITLSINTTGPKRNAFPCGAPCVGYVGDPQVGDESAVLACRRAGAWLFRTSHFDEQTLQFCTKYGIRIFLVLDGEQTELETLLRRLAQSPHKNAISGFQLGADTKDSSEPTKWLKIATLASRQFQNIPIALPVSDIDSPNYNEMKGYLGPFTHLMVDLRDASAPYEKLERIADKLRHESDKSLAKLRLLAVGSGRLTGMTDEQASAPSALVWQMHWIMSAFAVDKVDGVFVDRPYRADDFGLAMRHFWAATTGNRSLVGHGEGASSAEVAKPQAKAKSPSMSLDDDEGAGGLELNDVYTPGPVPVACANIAAGKPGDVEYLVLLAPPVKDDGQRVCLVIVNSSEENVKLSLDVNKNGGNVTSGWRRRLVPDDSNGLMLDSTRERKSRPFAEMIEPGEVTFLDFRI